MKKASKIAIIGVGYVGSSIAYALMLKNLAQEIVLIDNNLEKAKGEALDITHGIPYMGESTVFQGEYEDIAGCDMIIITAGKNRKKGQTRIELLEENITIMKDISQNIMRYYMSGIVLIVSNPVDALTYFMTKWCGLENGKIFGTGCLLDTSRLVTQVAEYIGLSNDNIHALVVGEHGDSQMPVWSRVMVGNAPIAEYCHMTGVHWDEQVRRTLSERVKMMGIEIIKSKERTHYGIATCVCYLVNSVMNDRHIIAPVSSMLKGEYDITGIAMSIPTVVGKNGAEKCLVEQWTEEEVLFLRRCADKMKANIVGFL